MWISINKDEFYDMGDTLDIFVGKNKVARLKVVKIKAITQQNMQELDCKVIDCKKDYVITFEMFTNKKGYINVRVMKN